MHGGFKHGLAIPLAHFICIPPLLTSMQSFIKIGCQLQKLFHLFRREVGWSKFFHRFIFEEDFHNKAPHKVSALYLKAFKSYPIVKDRRKKGGYTPSDTHPRHSAQKPTNLKVLVSKIAPESMSREIGVGEVLGPLFIGAGNDVDLLVLRRSKRDA